MNPVLFAGSSTLSKPLVEYPVCGRYAEGSGNGVWYGSGYANEVDGPGSWRSHGLGRSGIAASDGGAS